MSISSFIQHLVAGAAQISDTTKQEAYLGRIDFHKQTFSQFVSKITKHVFRRMFRMNLDAFNKLYAVFIKHIGVRTFLPQHVWDYPMDDYR